jgi:hypothetical protein
MIGYNVHKRFIIKCVITQKSEYRNEAHSVGRVSHSADTNTLVVLSFQVKHGTQSTIVPGQKLYRSIERSTKCSLRQIASGSP